VTHRFGKQTLFEDQLARGLDDIAANVLLQVGVVVVVDADQHIAGCLRQPLDQAGLAD